MKDEPYLSIDSKYKWVMLALIWLGYFAFGVIAYCIPPLITPIGQDLSLTYSQIGSILGAFILIYIPLSILVGILIDRAGMRKAIVARLLDSPVSASAILRHRLSDFILSYQHHRCGRAISLQSAQ